MAPYIRAILLTSLSVCVLAVTACSTTGSSNKSNMPDSNRVDSILSRAASEAKASGDKVQTITLLEKIYDRNPDDAAVATSFGQALREDEQLNRARQILYPFTEGKNAYTDAVVELSMVQLALGQYKEAELTSRRAVTMDEKSGRAFLALGTALDAQNYHEQAEVAFRRGIDNWKGDPAPIMNNLALNLASQSKLDQAIDMLLKAKEISPGRIEIERNLRIIRTLKESATDFTDKAAKVQEDKKPVPVLKPAAKIEPKKAPETDITTKKQDVEKTESQKATSQPVKILEKTTGGQKDKNDIATNKRGSNQNFGSKTPVE